MPFSQPSLPLAALLDQAAARVLERVEKGRPTPVILIDGRSGSGKTTFAAQLQNRLFQLGDSSPRVIHMDALYDGWNGLNAGSDYLLRFILGAVSRNKPASWQEYDWATNQRAGAWREFEGGTPLIVEGCGALSAASAELADLRIWLEADGALRKIRWDEREPEANSRYWAIWAAQEEDFYAREKSPTLADLIGDSSGSQQV